MNEGEWTKHMDGHTVKSVELSMSNVEYEWIHKRARRNGLTPEELVRSFLIKAICLEEVSGLTTVYRTPQGQWAVKCAQPDAVAK